MKKSLTITLIIVLCLALVAAGYYIYQQNKDMQEMVEQMAFEKEQLEEDYEDLAIQFDGYQQMNIQNDSLQERLAKEQQRVQDLLEELRVTRATNARRISELKKELATVRAVMVQYVAQIDSLNRTNEQLTKENKQLSYRYQTVSTQAQQLQREKTQLAAVVQRASMLEVSAFSVTPLNKRGRKTRMLGQMVKLQIDYTIAKNITCETGMKTLFVRVVDPNGNLLGEDNGYTFAFENGTIAASAYRELEYTGDAQSGALFVALPEEISQGFYNADFFIEGNMIGSFPFELKRK